MQITLNTANDNDVVMHAAKRVLDCAGDDMCERNCADLEISLQDARIADRCVSRGADVTGRESLGAALELHIAEGWSEKVRILLLTGMLQRAIGLKLF